LPVTLVNTGRRRDRGERAGDRRLAEDRDGAGIRDAGERQVVIAVVVERMYVLSLYRLLIRADDVPPAALVVREGRVIRLTQIRALANRRKSLELDGKDLSPQSQSQNAPA
jgi:hypothetical protein